MILVRRRQDLKEEGVLIPQKFGRHLKLDTWHKAFQPDELDYCEYNVIVLGRDNEVKHIVNSIDLEYGADV